MPDFKKIHAELKKKKHGKMNFYYELEELGTLRHISKADHARIYSSYTIHTELYSLKVFSEKDKNEPAAT
jgi:hypothetical protein